MKKAQAYLTYVLLIVAVAAALSVMAGYIRRRVQGSFKTAADSYGLEEQFDPGS